MESSQNGNGYDHDGYDSANVIDLAGKRTSLQPQKPPRQPPINLPPMTQAMLAALILTHVALLIFFSPDARFGIYETYGFVPARYTGRLPFIMSAFTAPVTFNLLHGSWMHLGMNTLMLAAFGAGTERWLGPWKMLLLSLFCGLCAALAHLALNPFSAEPMIGASGALSGQFAVIMVFMNRMRGGQGFRQMLPFILLWIAITTGFGMMGSPDGSPIAWAAHLGGFFGGLAFVRLMRL